MVLKASTKKFQTIAVRPPLVWGKGDPNTLVGVMEATKKGRMQFIDGGKHRLVTCHVANVYFWPLYSKMKDRYLAIVNAFNDTILYCSYTCILILKC
ncbi:hypothetical protein J2X69_003133 [Algoriphagus sp. 4150]|nr:hypothetical protein [Algoriphagus sp. 4150]